MAKAFVLAIKGIALMWYTSVPKRTIFSLEQLREVLFSHFQGNYTSLVTIRDLFTVKQKEGESLKEFTQRFVWVKCQVKGLSDDTVIDSTRQGLRSGALASRLVRKPAKDVDELFTKMEEYSRAEEDELLRHADRSASETQSYRRGEEKASHGKEKEECPRETYQSISPGVVFLNGFDDVMTVSPRGSPSQRADISVTQ
ncbi:uncharacterized protein LOC133900181 [Phragmites australis]|uniref:uncharacterized protein LOC133900181 n=1 Tax=Phragmites australis TaxID=29695 RepID=UPI002D77FB3D|nr:uncharacterized protein LOC133900181 [Phragmites australis]